MGRNFTFERIAKEKRERRELSQKIMMWYNLITESIYKTDRLQTLIARDKKEEEEEKNNSNETV